jgi:3',5'-cyclic AMP phosphodiesterase CpdA
MSTHDAPGISRRRFLQQSFVFSAATLGSLPALASPPPLDPSAAHLLILGDWGRDSSQVGQRAVADGMVRYAPSVKPQALVMLGDSWYGALDGGVESPRWKWQFEDMYPASAFPGPAYSVLGNHDYQRWPGSKVDYELAYARTGKSRFTLPAKWYTFTFPKHDPLITFIALDSNMPGGHGAGDQGVDFTLTDAERVEQLAWFETQLKRPRTTPHLVVIAHHPVYSDGPHGDHATLIRDWDPLLRKYNVPLYMAGHDHDLQHLELKDHPTSFLLSGAGGADLYDLKIPATTRGPFAEKVFGFSHLEVNRKVMTLRHLDSKGQVLHAFTKDAEGKVSILS